MRAPRAAAARLLRTAPRRVWLRRPAALPPPEGLEDWGDIGGPVFQSPIGKGPVEAQWARGVSSHAYQGLATAAGSSCLPASGGVGS